MANTQLFAPARGALLPAADTRNFAGAPAYRYGPKHELAQLAATGCLHHTFYASADVQLDTVLRLAREVDAEFLAKTALHARQAGHMKDMPALLLAVLAQRDGALLARVFDRVADNGRMLRNFVQMVRSGVTGRKSLGSRPKRLVQQWLARASEAQLLQASVGNAPSLADVVKMVHPKAAEPWRNAWFAWLLGQPVDAAALPPLTLTFEQWKKALRDNGAREGGPLPDVPFQLLTALPLARDHWAQLARNGSWQMVRQGLNMFARHGVFEVRGVTEAVAAKLRDPAAMARARVLPYQLLAAYRSVDAAVPPEVREALQDAMEAALANVPAVPGRVVVCPDVSGSMASAVTGARGSATSTVRCIDVAALVAAAFVRRNPGALVLPFEQSVVTVQLNARDAVMTNAQKLAAIGGGGTNVSAPLALLNARKARVDLVVIVSDNQSWVDVRHGATATMREWAALKARNPGARLVCVDLQPYGTTQATERADVLNVGGFSDAVFPLVASFAAGGDAAHWVDVIEQVTLPGLPA